MAGGVKPVYGGYAMRQSEIAKVFKFRIMMAGGALIVKTAKLKNVFPSHHRFLSLPVYVAIKWRTMKIAKHLYPLKATN